MHKIKAISYRCFLIAWNKRAGFFNTLVLFSFLLILISFLVESFSVTPVCFFMLTLFCMTGLLPMLVEHQMAHDYEKGFLSLLVYDCFLLAAYYIASMLSHLVLFGLPALALIYGYVYFIYKDVPAVYVFLGIHYVFMLTAIVFMMAAIGVSLKNYQGIIRFLSLLFLLPFWLLMLKFLQEWPMDTESFKGLFLGGLLVYMPVASVFGIYFLRESIQTRI